MGHVSPSEKNLISFVSLGIAEILSYSKLIHNILNYASTANIEEVMKFYYLGDKTFETDFSRLLLTKLSSLVGVV